MDIAQCPIQAQMDDFCATVSSNPTLCIVLSRAATLGLPNWYLAGGAVSQTIWNKVSGLPLETGISDYDLVYYDPSDLSWEAEDSVIQAGKKLFADIPVEVEIRNQSRVHLWYAPKFGVEFPQHKSVEAAIDMWISTSAMIGIRLLDDGKWDIYAPHGFSDFYKLIVRPNAVLGNREVYEKKVARWKGIWKDLKAMPWVES